MTCPRNMTREEIITGLKAGRTLNMDRMDAPELDDLRDLEREGLVEGRVVEIDEQSTIIKWTWKQ